MDAAPRAVQRGWWRMKRFPIDCPADCPHHIAWDLSVDDWTHVCEILHIQMDECDIALACLPFCPLKEDGGE